MPSKRLTTEGPRSNARGRSQLNATSGVPPPSNGGGGRKPQPLFLFWHRRSSTRFVLFSGRPHRVAVLGESSRSFTRRIGSIWRCSRFILLTFVRLARQRPTIGHGQRQIEATGRTCGFASLTACVSGFRWGVFFSVWAAAISTDRPRPCRR